MIFIGILRYFDEYYVVLMALKGFQGILRHFKGFQGSLGNFKEFKGTLSDSKGKVFLTILQNFKGF